MWGGVRARRQREPGPSTVRARALVQKGEGPPRSATRYPLKGPGEPSIREVPGNSLSRKGIRALRLARLRRRTLRVERTTGPHEDTGPVSVHRARAWPRMATARCQWQLARRVKHLAAVGGDPPRLAPAAADEPTRTMASQRSASSDRRRRGFVTSAITVHLEQGTRSGVES